MRRRRRHPPDSLGKAVRLCSRRRHQQHENQDDDVELNLWGRIRALGQFQMNLADDVDGRRATIHHYHQPREEERGTRGRGRKRGVQ